MYRKKKCFSFYLFTFFEYSKIFMNILDSNYLVMSFIRNQLKALSTTRLKKYINYPAAVRAAQDFQCRPLLIQHSATIALCIFDSCNLFGKTAWCKKCHQSFWKLSTIFILFLVLEWCDKRHALLGCDLIEVWDYVMSDRKLSRVEVCPWIYSFQSFWQGCVVKPSQKALKA